MLRLLVACALSPGDQMPSFDLQDARRGRISDEDLLGKPTLISTFAAS